MIMVGQGKFSLVCGLACLMLLAGEASAQQAVRYEARFEAKYPQIAAEQSIGVINFNGQDGAEFSSILISELQSAAIDQKQVFSVRTMDSMNYTADNTISNAEVAKTLQLGRKLGVNVIFTGTVTTAAIRTNNFTRSESTCAKSSGLFKCDQTVTQKVPCSTTIGQYTVSPRAVKVSTGAVIYAEAVAVQDEYTICNGQVEDPNVSLGSVFNSIFGGSKKGEASPPPVSTPEGLLSKLRSDAAQIIRRHVAPYNRTIEVKLKPKGRNLDKAGQQQFENAVAFAKAGRIDRACSIFETLYAGNNQANVDLLYNMGVCQEALLPDEPSAAFEYYARADQLLQKPDTLISEAYTRTKAMIGQSQSLNERKVP
jgi:hypothetical protein